LPGYGCTRNCTTLREMTKPRKHGVAPRLSRWDIRGEARMTNDEGMTKSEDRGARNAESFWDDGAALVREQPETKRVYDLEERTARFGEAIIDFAKAIPQKSDNQSNHHSTHWGRH